MPRFERRGERLAFAHTQADDAELLGHVLVADRLCRDVERVDEREAAAEQRGQRPRHLRRRELLRHVAEHRQAEQHVIEPGLLPRLAHPGDDRDHGRNQPADDQQELRAEELGDGHDHTGAERQLRAERAVEVREGRHDLQDDDRHEDEGQRNQDRRIHERGDRFALDRRDDLRVFDVAAQRRVQVAAALAGEERRGVDAREQSLMRVERVRQRRARSHLLVHVVQHAAEGRRRDAALQQVERLHERHTGLQQRRQLLVEHQEFARVDPFALRQLQRDARDGVLGLKRQDEQPLLLELMPQTGLVVGDIDAFHDFTVGRCEPAAEFHSAVNASVASDLPVIVSTSARSP